MGEITQNKEGWKGKILSGLFWRFLEQISYQGIQLIFSLFLLRILDTEEVGAVSVISIFITIANTFIQSGFSQALMQKKEIKEEDYSSVFYLTLALSGGIYLLFYGISPFVAEFYHLPVLESLLRQMSILLFPGAVISIQMAYAGRALQFRPIFLASFFSSLFSGVLAVFLAYRGYGSFAMAYQQISYYFFTMLILFLCLPWRPKLLFKLSSLSALFHFGWKILFSGLLDQIWQNIYGLVIGKRYKVEELALYNRGEMFPKLLSSTLSTMISGVMFPAFSKMQEEKDALQEMARKTIRFSAFLLFPILFGLMAVAKPFIILLLTKKWIGMLPYLRFLSVTYLFLPLHMCNLQLMNSQGRSDLFLKLEIIKKILGIGILLLTFPFGIFVMLFGKNVGEVLCLYLNAKPNEKLIQYGFLSQVKDCLASFTASFLMGGIVYLVQGFLEKRGMTELWQLIVLIPLGAICYTVVSFIVNRNDIKTLCSFIHVRNKFK
ncbi:lipopolysaccharide biosynthesis protein [uncultured Oribacterium sp.]|uniref:lipopolysaccharide biosynthesis protein n=1 Tax=uncultured Oribacterium sp. TaxID=462198 RepID=UPI002806018B|nr:lipopolysaccharide biosynthesis protein [uncultured Oribacterium sp.]